MTDIFVVGNREESSYLVDFEMGEIFLPIKYDTGAKYTVISARALNHNLKEGTTRLGSLSQASGLFLLQNRGFRGTLSLDYFVRICVWNAAQT